MMLANGGVSALFATITRWSRGSQHISSARAAPLVLITCVTFWLNRSITLTEELGLTGVHPFGCAAGHGASPAQASRWATMRTPFGPDVSLFPVAPAKPPLSCVSTVLVVVSITSTAALVRSPRM